MLISYAILVYYRDLIILDKLGYFIDQVTTEADKSAKVILVANKCDLVEEKKVWFETGKLFANANGLDYFETSCKSLEQIEFVFVSLVSSILADRNKETENSPLKQSSLLQTASRSSFSGCCFL